MKSILLSMCVVALASSAVIAQSNNQNAQASVSKTAIASKTQFSSSVKELDGHLKSNNAEKAKLVYDNLQLSMNQSLSETKMKMAQLQTEAERAPLMEVYRKKQTLFVEIHNLSKDLTANRQAINTKLNEFSTIGF